MLSADRSRAWPAIALPVIFAVVLLACGDVPPAIETTTVAVPSAEAPTVPLAGPGAALPAAGVPLAGPQAVAFDPPLGATEVDPQRTTLTVTFDRPMDPEGWAWVTESSDTAPEIGESRWDAAVQVHTAEVTLAPGRTYVVWINSPQYSYFRDTEGRTLTPVRWSFSTAAGSAPTAGVDAVSSHR